MTTYNKSLTFIPLILMMSLCLITPALGAGCENPLLATYTGFNPLTTPAAITEELKYCKFLKSSSCCPAATINTFQARAHAFQAEIVTIVEKRDKLLVANRDTEIPIISAKLAYLKTKATAAETYLKTADASFSTGKELTVEQSLAITTSLKTIATQATDGLAALKTNLGAFQRARATCMSDLLRLQASVWCLACDPAFAFKGVEDDQSIYLDDETCGRLESNCYDYITGSAAQSNLTLAQQLNAGLTEAIDGLDTISKGTALGIDKLVKAVKAIEAAAKTTSHAAAVQTPATCTSKTECTWLCSSMFKKGAAGAVDKDLAAQGGEVNKAITMPAGSGRMLLDGAGRSLAATGTFKPAADESGVRISFPIDPALVNNDDGDGGENGNGDGNGNGEGEYEVEPKSATRLVNGLLCIIIVLMGVVLF